mmetsp:Transcript_39561/g.64122  ORF Transcript_39561/g.64122 Transcript_39561/m.64122 type:complete len:205 (+) Transcript_39561:395-1009(+)|eukprot:CAMPEP_0203745544 /NCGR_PEP_ID=MMETSP0098-20131031/1242_1 /ASSEMBLY_ACC=CAM_ASM_000208 /TAXON_ID=96639 /ORGANISM=" , Strain NY0313808BC1" /LENGTH=204 /DNA_ID=CAMNT_0050633347 /DNA_START=103 /DNA_END=717 /DNA_ORIENTATION=+
MGFRDKLRTAFKHDKKDETTSQGSSAMRKQTSMNPAELIPRSRSAKNTKNSESIQTMSSHSSMHKTEASHLTDKAAQILGVQVVAAKTKTDSKSSIVVENSFDADMLAAKRAEEQWKREQEKKRIARQIDGTLYREKFEDTFRQVYLAFQREYPKIKITLQEDELYEQIIRNQVAFDAIPQFVQTRVQEERKLSYFSNIEGVCF